MIHRPICQQLALLRTSAVDYCIRLVRAAQRAEGRGCKSATSREREASKFHGVVNLTEGQARGRADSPDS